MKNITLREAVYDILTDLRQMHGNAKITENQALFWILATIDRLKKQHIEKRESGLYITSFVVDNIINGEFELPKPIYDFHLDKGVSYIVEDGDIYYTRVYKPYIRRLYYREEEKPSEDNPYFYVEEGKIKLLGRSPEEVEIGLFTTFNPTEMSSIDIDEPLEFPLDLYMIAKRQILDLGVWAIQTPRTLRSDAPVQGQPPSKKFLSVDDAADPDLEEGQVRDQERQVRDQERR